MVVLPEAIED
jgi:hypothetical protein